MTEPDYDACLFNQSQNIKLLSYDDLSDIIFESIGQRLRVGPHFSLILNMNFKNDRAIFDQIRDKQLPTLKTLDIRGVGKYTSQIAQMFDISKIVTCL